MPMYFPDLKSVKDIATEMTKHLGDKKYTGLIPDTEEELPKARKELGQYFRTVWRDEVQAMEIEQAVTKENYESKLGSALMKKLIG